MKSINEVRLLNVVHILDIANNLVYISNNFMSDFHITISLKLSLAFLRKFLSSKLRPEHYFPRFVYLLSITARCFLCLDLI